MRLPWLQVDQEGITACKLLARLLGVPDTQGIGIGMAMWSYALEIAPEGDFAGIVPEPGILAAAVGWNVEDAPRLVECLQRVGLITTAPTLRVRGLDRYRRSWEKNTGKKAKSLKSGDVVPEPGANPARLAPEPARQTQIETQKQIENKAAAADQVIRLPSPQPPRVVDRHRSGSAYLAFLNAERLAAGLLPDTSLHPQKFDAWFSEIMGEVNGDGERIDATVAAFSRDPYWKKQQLPLRALLKQWRDFVPRKAAAR